MGATANAQSMKELAEQQLLKLHSSGTNLEFEKVKISNTVKRQIEKSCKQKFFRDELYTWKVHNADSVIGYAILDNVYGKTELITFLVVFDQSGTVNTVKIIKYRSSRGREVEHEGWLAQFKGSDSSAELRPGQDIDVISGATYSVNSMTKGVKKLLLLFPKIINSIKK